MTEIVDRKIRTTLYETRDVVRSLSSILILAVTIDQQDCRTRKPFIFEESRDGGHSALYATIHGRNRVSARHAISKGWHCAQDQSWHFLISHNTCRQLTNDSSDCRVRPAGYEDTYVSNKPGAEE